MYKSELINCVMLTTCC